MAHSPRAHRRAGARLARVACVLLVLSLAGTTAAEESACSPRGHVLLIRGIFNVFSTGMDRLAEQLERSGYEVEVTPPAGCITSAWRLRDKYLQGPAPRPVVLIGHSMGGRACLHISRYLESYKIPVELVVVADSNPWTSVPGNVRRCVNLYVTNPFGVFHGTPVRGSSGAKIVNVDVTKVKRPDWASSVNHFNIDNSTWMHRVIQAEVDRACSTQGWTQSTTTARPVSVQRPQTGPPAQPPKRMRRRRRHIEVRL